MCNPHVLKEGQAVHIWLGLGWSGGVEPVNWLGEGPEPMVVSVLGSEPDRCLFWLTSLEVQSCWSDL